MSFDTVTFWLFFALAWTAWRALPFGAAKTAVLAFSLFFYAWWNPWFCTLIAASSVVDYVVGARIHASDDAWVRKRWLLASLVFNLGLLGFFKYTPFLAQNLAALVGGDWQPDLSGWIVPVGISFYTFQTLSYSLDIHARRIAPAASFRDFFLYVSFFPQLVAGPIVRARELLPQFARRRRLNARLVQAGLYHVIWGLFLKMVIADNLAPAVGRVFRPEGIGELAPLSVWLGVVYFSVQIFADFAGYSGIAIGLAYLMGLRFPRNFRYPYIAAGLSDFWRRWHITLSEWLRDYLYIPLGGNRHGRVRMWMALSLTMLLGGLWHGAAWTYVAWGALHGVGLIAERLVVGERRGATPTGAPRGAKAWSARLARMAVVYVFVLVTWVFFRAEDFAMAGAVLARMFTSPFSADWSLPASNWRYLALVLPVFGMHAGQLFHEWFGLRKSAVLRAAVAALMLFALTVFRRGSTVEFIYFQF